MNQRERDLGVLTAVIERFEHWEHRWMREISERLDRGEAPREEDIVFLEAGLKQIQQVLAVVDRNPDYQHLAEQIIEAFQALVKRALDNEEHPR